ncbi:hypothetical protein [Aeromicrobium duanguangcaii]|uniref:hypothetical protein n=1 Tax=Aeromicrobium duanguangcaii TaxID=2968086 RepID=UPI00201754AB|nr:hypothetical protein [Aeromicrobium duanguangcaii]MCL3838012.1 hypothetical protein [Aeromicrobium duanguangcaii]
MEYVIRTGDPEFWNRPNIGLTRQMTWEVFRNVEQITEEAAWNILHSLDPGDQMLLGFGDFEKRRRSAQWEMGTDEQKNTTADPWDGDPWLGGSPV